MIKIMDIEVSNCDTCPFLDKNHGDPVFVELFCSLNSKKLPYSSLDTTPEDCDLKKLKKVIVKWV